MKKSNARKLPCGVYRLHWRAGGSSLASVGRLDGGITWFAPSNWHPARPEEIVSVEWTLVFKVEPIAIEGSQPMAEF